MRLRALPATSWAKLGLGGLCLVALVGFLAFPTYPIYDSEYYLLWGREILHLHTPSFAAYDAPTEHPLAVAYGTVLAIFGNAALRLIVLSAVASFVILAAGLYRLARVAFAPAVGAVAVLLLCTRFNLVFLAIRGYVDITFLAAVVWAAALEIERPRRGTPVFLLLGVAELIRPDASLLAGLYWLWCFPHADWRQRIRWAAICAIGPVAWFGLDLLVTGDPLWSLHATNNLAVALNRTVPLSGVPSATGKYLVGLIKGPLVGGGLAGILLAAWFVPKRIWMSLVILVTGILMFAVIAAAGLSVIDRYLLLPAVILLAFCAFALMGWTMLEAGVVRRVWAAGAPDPRAVRGRQLREGAEPQLRAERARLSRQRPHRARGDPRQSGRQARSALRPGVGSKPQADPRHALGRRRASERRDRAQRRGQPPAAWRRGSATASRSTRSTSR